MAWDANGNWVMDNADTMAGFRTDEFGPRTLEVGSGLSGLNTENFSAPSSSGWDLGILGKLFGGKNADGSVNPNYAGALLGAFQAWNAFKTGREATKLAKDQLGFSKDSFYKNYNAQVDSIKNQYADTNAARNASRQGAASNPYQPLVFRA